VAPAADSNRWDLPEESSCSHPVWSSPRPWQQEEEEEEHHHHESSQGILDVGHLRCAAEEEASYRAMQQTGVGLAVVALVRVGPLGDCRGGAEVESCGVLPPVVVWEGQSRDIRVRPCCPCSKGGADVEVDREDPVWLCLDRLGGPSVCR
jgi:hypothetical protein